jgi:glycosyltransferase involved in cell wall biosynthesis
MRLPRISIIIPCYNAEALLPECLDNVVALDYPDTEIILVDGASGDHSPGIIRSYAEKNRCIRWISEKDRGVYDAMNKGVEMATGEWLYFLGTDDRFYSGDVLSRLFADNDLGKFSLVYGNVEFLHSKQIYDGPFNLHKLIFVSNICHQAAFYRKTIFEKIGPFDLRCRIYADRDFNIRCFANKRIRTKYVDRLIAVYNEQDGLSARDKQDAAFRDKQNSYIKEYHRRPLQRIALMVRWTKTVLKRLLTKIN